MAALCHRCYYYPYSMKMKTLGRVGLDGGLPYELGWCPVSYAGDTLGAWRIYAVVGGCCTAIRGCYDVLECNPCGEKALVLAYEDGSEKCLLFGMRLAMLGELIRVLVIWS